VNKKMLKKIVNKKILLLLGLLLFPLFVEGFALDPVMTILQGTAEHVGPWLTIFMVCFFIFVLGVFALALTTSLLQAIIEITPEALTVLQGESAVVVQAGWNFTVGIANMMLLVAFIFIAITLVLGNENFALKKSLPKIVAVALLMNFTLLFVGMGIDISNFLFNSVASQFSEESGNVLWNAINPLLIKTGPLVLGGVSFLGTLLSWNLTVMGTVVARTIIGFGFLALLPFIIQFLMYGLVLLSLSGLFMLFFFIFLARILIIQILAIVAPLAFFCLIFDETKNFWSKWLHHLIQWLFVGVVFIFLMYVGLALAPIVGTIVEPLVDATNWPFWLKWWSGEIISHLVLLVYFFVILGFIRQFIPDLAKAAVTQAKKAVQAVAPYGDAIKKGSKLGRLRRIQERAKEDVNYKKRKEENLYAAPIDRGGLLQRQLSRAGANYKRLTSKEYENAINAGQEKFKDTEEKLKGQGKEGYEGAFKNAVASEDYTKALASFFAAVKEGKNSDLLYNMVNKDPELERKLSAEASLYGKEKDYKKFVIPTKEIERINSTGTAKEKEEKLQNFLLQYSNSDMEKMASIFTKAANDKTNPSDMKNVELLLKQLVKSSEGMQRAYVKGSEREGMQVLYKMAKADPNPAIEKDFCRAMGKGTTRALMSDEMRRTYEKTKK
jgi:hypothetical protein